MSDYRVATRYAKALFQLAEEQQATDAIQADLAQLRRLLDASPELGQFVAHAGLTPAEQRDTMGAVFKGRVHELVWRLLDLLIERRRLAMLPNVCEAFGDRFREARHILNAHVVSAAPLQPQQLEALRSKLAAAYDRKIDLMTATDPSLLGGLVVRVRDRVHDASIKGQLAILRATLAQHA